MTPQVPRRKAFVLLFAFLLTTLFLTQSSHGEAGSPYNSFLEYPDYTMARFQADMRTMRQHLPPKDETQAFAEKQAIKFFTDKALDYVGDKYAGNVTIDLVANTISAYMNEDGDFYASSKTVTMKAIEPVAKMLWDKMKDQAIEHVLGSTLAETFGVVGIAAMPIQILESAWVMYITGLRGEDMTNALKWYVRERTEYDYKRHRDLMLSGQRFTDIQPSPLFPFDFDPQYRNPAPYPFTAYGFEPYYINVEAQTQATWILGDWHIFLGGAPYSVGDERQGFYDLWANIMYAELNINGTDLDKELRALSKNAGSAYVRGIVKRHANACLRDFMYEFEKYYYDLYTTRILFEIRNSLKTEAFIIAMLRWRDREILREKAETEEEYQALLEAYEQGLAYSATHQSNALNAEVEADVHIGDRDAESNQTERCNYEALYVQDMIAAMTNAAESARDCESGRVNYGKYVDFIDSYGATSTNYATLECSENQSTYLSAYNVQKQDLQTRWQNNVTEFTTLRNELAAMGKKVCGTDNDPYKEFSAVREYSRKIGNVAEDILAGLSTPAQNVFIWLWNTNFDETSASYVEGLTPAELADLTNDIETVRCRLTELKTTMDDILKDFPTRDEVVAMEEKAKRAEVIYNDLVEGSPSLTPPRGAWQSYNRSFTSITHPSSCQFYRYAVQWSITASLWRDPAHSDLVNFSTDDYSEYALHFLGLTSIDPMEDRDAAITNSIDFAPVEKFREVTDTFYREIDGGFGVVAQARDAINLEETWREAETNYQWHRLYQEPAENGLPYSANLHVPLVDGQGGCYSMAITTNDIGVIGFLPKGIRTIDVSSPTNPLLLSQTNLMAIVEGTDVYGDTAVLSGFAVDIALIDISDPENLPAPSIQRFTNPNDDGWSRDVAVHGDYAYVADGPGGLKIYDLRTVTNAPSGIADGVLSLTGALYVAVSYPYAYVACGTNGFDVVDVTTPTNPVLAVHKDTDPVEVLQVEVENDHALLSLGSNGVAFVDISSPSNPVTTDIDMNPGFYVRHAVQTGDTVLAVGDIDFSGGIGYLQVYTVNDGGFLTRQQQYDLQSSARHIALHDGYAWISCTYSGRIYSVEVDRISPTEEQRRTDTPYSFEPRVEVQVYGSGSGIVTMDPAGLTISDRLVTNLVTGTVVTVTAYADSNMTFLGWDGYSTTTSTSVTFSMASNTYLAARFDAPENVITSSASAGGSVDPEGAVTVLVNEAQSFTFSNETDYVISNVFVDGTAIGSVDEYQFENVTNAHSIHVSFLAVDSNSCGVAAGAGPGGSVSPFGWNAFAEGATVTHTITADPGYTIANVAVDETNYAAISSFVFTNISGVHNLRAEFVNEARIITTEHNLGGRADPASTEVLLADGTGATITVSADPWYYIASVESNDTPIGTWDDSTTSAVYSFTWPASNIALKVQFQPQRTTNTETPLWWLIEQGITSDFENAVLLDQDSDGVPTWREYVADTHAGSGTSVFEFSQAMLTNLVGGTGWVVSCYGSADRLYELEGVNDLSGTSSWEDLVQPFAGSNSMLELHLTNAPVFLRMRATVP